VSIRLEIPLELAYLAPALKIIVGISALLERDNLGKVTKEQRKGPLGSYNADGHIMLVKHKNIAVQTGIELAGNHNIVCRISYIVFRVSMVSGLIAQAMCQAIYTTGYPYC